MKNKILQATDNEWRTVGNIAKRAESYPFATKPILEELVKDGLVETNMKGKRLMYRKKDTPKSEWAKEGEEKDYIVFEDDIKPIEAI